MLKKLIWKFLARNSKPERWLRSWYHRVDGSKWMLRYKLGQAHRSYDKWMRNQPVALSRLQTPPTVRSVVFVIAAKAIDQLEKTVKSIRLQAGVKTDLLILDNHGTLANGLAEITADYVVFAEEGDIFSPDYARLMVDAAGDTGAVCVYCDAGVQASDAGGWFKPKTLTQFDLLSVNPMSRGLFRRQWVVENLDGASSLSQAEQLLAEKAIGRNDKVAHVPWVLINVEEVDESEGKFTLEHDRPKVSIIIPSRDKALVLKKLLDSLFAMTEYPEYEVIIVDNQSSEAAAQNLYDEMKSRHPVTVVPFDQPFNYSAALNTGARAATGEVLVFLNNDMEVIDPHWLDELVQWTSRPEVGIVGGKLLRENGTIQHAGLVRGMQDFFGHLYLDAPDHYFGLAGSVDWYRTVTAVTGACQAVRRDKFEQLGGYDEGYRLIFSDVDLCLRASQRGWQTLYTPHTRLRHLEGVSRGYDTPIADIELGFKRLKEWGINDDAHYSPNLTLTTIPRAKT